MRQLRKYESVFNLINTKLLPDLSYAFGKEKLQFDLEMPEESNKAMLSWFKSKYNQAKYFNDSEIIPR